MTAQQYGGYSAQGPRTIAASATGKLLDVNPKRLNLSVQNHGACVVLMKKDRAPISTTDGYKLEVGATLSDAGIDVHKGEWWYREVRGQTGTLHITEN